MPCARFVQDAHESEQEQLLLAYFHNLQGEVYTLIRNFHLQVRSLIKSYKSLTCNVTFVAILMQHSGLDLTHITDLLKKGTLCMCVLH